MPAVPAAPAVPAVPVVPAAPAVDVDADVDGAAVRQPVTVIRLSFDALLCGGAAGVCATIAAVAQPIIAEHVAIQVLVIMRVLRCDVLQPSDRKTYDVLDLIRIYLVR